MILTYLDSQLAIFDFSHLQGVNLVKIGPKTETLRTSSISAKIRVFQNALKSICTTMSATCGQNFSSTNIVYRSYCPKTHQNRHNWIINQKTIVLLLGKVENDKYTETETWHPERVGNFVDPVWVQKSVFFV